MKPKYPVYKLALLPFKDILHLIGPLCKKLNDLDMPSKVITENEDPGDAMIINFRDFAGRSSVALFELVEYVIQQLPFQFNTLPDLLEGESKIIKLLNSKIVVEQFKPTVYSFTHNRYGEAEGTAEMRVLFTAEIFRNMNRYNIAQKKNLKNAFLAVVSSDHGPLLVQEKVDTCNLEVRVKRYHIGSPVHRYKYTEKFDTQQSDNAPLEKWSRFDVPVVCFDWRLPLTDENGNRLADEPISDDYASIWMDNIAGAKTLSRDTFLWLEQLFRDSGLLLIDICFFVDKTGKMLYGEISQDCMRVREGLGDPKESASFDKDLWRQGEKEQLLSDRYNKLYTILFNQSQAQLH